MPSIVNGLFAGRAGLSSHGAAIAVVGDNISNTSTVGFKSGRAEFSDLMAGGQVTGKVIGSGSQLAGVSTINDQGTLEFTSRPLDLAVDGNGYFVLAEGAQRYYTRAGNFKINAAGNIIAQGEQAVLGFPQGGDGSLEPINVNGVQQNSVETKAISISGNLNASAVAQTEAAVDALIAGTVAPGTTTFSELNAASEFSTVVSTFDSLGAQHTLTYFFFKMPPTAGSATTYRAYGVVNSEEVDAPVGTVGLPRTVSAAPILMEFGSAGTRTNNAVLPAHDEAVLIPWNNGSTTTAPIDVDLKPFTSYSAASNILAINQDGQGVGSVTSVSIQRDGKIFAILDNGQSSNIGTIGLVNFANAEGLVRLGGNLLQKSPQSGEPIVGEPDSGRLGSISAGSLELSTVDIASEFVKLITLQRGFQANSRIITTINQLLNDIIQLV